MKSIDINFCSIKYLIYNQSRYVFACTFKVDEGRYLPILYKFIKIYPNFAVVKFGGGFLIDMNKIIDKNLLSWIDLNIAKYKFGNKGLVFVENVDNNL